MELAWKVDQGSEVKLKDYDPDYTGDDSPGLKPRGFSGSLRRLNPPSEGKDI